MSPLPSRSILSARMLRSEALPLHFLVAGGAVVDLHRERVGGVATGAGVVGRAVLEAAGIALAGVFVADLGHGAVQHGRRRGVMHIDEVELRRDLIVGDLASALLTLSVNSTPWWQVMQRALASRWSIVRPGRKGDRRQHAGLVVVAGHAGDDGADRRRMVDLERRRAVGAEIVAETGRRMAARAFDRDRALLVPVIERLGAAIGMRRRGPFGVVRHVGGRDRAGRGGRLGMRVRGARHGLRRGAGGGRGRRRLRAQLRRQHQRAGRGAAGEQRGGKELGDPALDAHRNLLQRFTSVAPAMPEPRMKAVVGGTGAWTRLK